MTRQKQILYSKKKTGVFLILIFTICFLSDNGFSQDTTTLQIMDLRRLARQFQKNDQAFLSYVYNLSFYHLTKDSIEKLQSGLEALNAAISTSHFKEGEVLIKQLMNDFPEHRTNLKYKYSYLLLMKGQFRDGYAYLRNLKEPGDLSARRKFLLAYAQLNLNRPTSSLKSLSQIEEQFPYTKNLGEIKNALDSEPTGPKKYKIIAVPLSIVLPGAGQLYSGFYFDAIQSFGFNVIFGYAAFASWRYELDSGRKNRTYILPVLSSIVWGLFYLTNIYNAANAADKANLFRLNKYYRAILEKFRFVLKDDAYFLNVQLKF